MTKRKLMVGETTIYDSMNVLPWVCECENVKDQRLGLNLAMGQMDNCLCGCYLG